MQDNEDIWLVACPFFTPLPHILRPNACIEHAIELIESASNTVSVKSVCAHDHE